MPLRFDLKRRRKLKNIRSPLSLGSEGEYKERARFLESRSSGQIQIPKFFLDDEKIVENILGHGLDASLSLFPLSVPICIYKADYRELESRPWHILPPAGYLSSRLEMLSPADIFLLYGEEKEGPAAELGLEYEKVKDSASVSDLEVALRITKINKAEQKRFRSVMDCGGCGVNTSIFSVSDHSAGLGAFQCVENSGRVLSEGDIVQVLDPRVLMNPVCLAEFVAAAFGLESIGFPETADESGEQVPEEEGDVVSKEEEKSLMERAMGCLQEKHFLFARSSRNKSRGPFSVDVPSTCGRVLSSTAMIDRFLKRESASEHVVRSIPSDFPVVVVRWDWADLLSRDWTRVSQHGAQGQKINSGSQLANEFDASESVPFGFNDDDKRLSGNLASMSKAIADMYETIFVAPVPDVARQERLRDPAGDRDRLSGAAVTEESSLRRTGADEKKEELLGFESTWSFASNADDEGGASFFSRRS